MSQTETTAPMSNTTIAVSDELADELYRRKGRGESYEDVIWRLIEAVDEREDAVDENPPQFDPDPVPDHRDQSDTGDDGSTDVDEDDHESPADPVATIDVPGDTEAERELKREAIRAAYDYLRENGEIQKSVAIDEVYPDADGGYASGGGWWNMVQPRLKQLPGTVKSGNKWLYRDPDDGADE